MIRVVVYGRTSTKDEPIENQIDELTFMILQSKDQLKMREFLVTLNLKTEGIFLKFLRWQKKKSSMNYGLHQ
jgi:predicted site-specific integrase-resolvase